MMNVSNRWWIPISYWAHISLEAFPWENRSIPRDPKINRQLCNNRRREHRKSAPFDWARVTFGTAGLICFRDFKAKNVSPRNGRRDTNDDKKPRKIVYQFRISDRRIEEAEVGRYRGPFFSSARSFHFFAFVYGGCSNSLNNGNAIFRRLRSNKWK